MPAEKAVFFLPCQPCTDVCLSFFKDETFLWMASWPVSQSVNQSSTLFQAEKSQKHSWFSEDES